jgi:hypothetical protein
LKAKQSSLFCGSYIDCNIGDIAAADVAKDAVQTLLVDLLFQCITASDATASNASMMRLSWIQVDNLV